MQYLTPHANIRRQVGFLSCFLVLASVSPANAALIAVDRLSEISGSGAAGPFDIPDSSARTTDLYETFDVTLKEELTEGWIESYEVRQYSAVNGDGFTLSTSYAGDATSGPFFGVSVYTLFQLTFFVDTPSVLTLSGAYSGESIPGVTLVRGSPDGGFNAASFVEYAFGDALPIQVALLPLNNYRFSFYDDDSISSFSPKPPFSASYQFSATLTPIPEPTTQALWVMGLLCAVLAFRSAKPKGSRSGE